MAKGRLVVMFTVFTLLVASSPVSLALKSCVDQCRSLYSLHTSGEKEFPRNVNTCSTGCRLYSIIDTVDFDPFSGKSHGALENCKKSCSSSYKDENDVFSCNKGCEFQEPISKERRNEMSSVLDSFFGNMDGGIFSSMPSIRIAVPQDLSNMFSEGSSSMGRSFMSMFDNMRGHMNNMMQQMFGPMRSGQNLQPGHGRMVVIKSGPGFHEEKTYDIGPDGVKTEIENNNGSVDDEPVKQLQNDMIAKQNPLEKLVNPNDVEVFKPEKVEKTKTIRKFDEFGSNEIEDSNEDSDENSKEKIIPVDILGPLFERNYESKPFNADRSYASVQGYDFPSELSGPKLPEDGLRTGDHRRRLYCAESSEKMNWSDWVSCLHYRMGMPRWFTAISLSLAIVFIVWLCLVIPQNAPKQTVKVSKALEAASKLEKEHLAQFSYHPPPPPAYKQEMPPAYDDIAGLHVAVTVDKEQGQNKKNESEEAPKA